MNTKQQRLRIFRVILLSLLLLSQGCKLTLSVEGQGQIQSSSGNNDCTSTCEISVTGGDFLDTFTAVPNAGYSFAGWTSGASFLCGGTKSACALSTVGYDAFPEAALLFNNGDFELKLQAVFQAGPAEAEQGIRPNFAGFSGAEGELESYVAPSNSSDNNKKLLAIYLVGSDLEDNGDAGTTDLNELIQGYNQLSSSDQSDIDIVVAMGGAEKSSWKGMRIMTMAQIITDSADGVYGNSDDSSYYAANAHMGDDSSLALFLRFLKDGYDSHGIKFLDMWDHGAAYGSFGNDMNFDGDGLTMAETDAAMTSVGMSFDIIGYDACLNGNFELASVIKKHASYLVGSEELEPGHGWNYVGVIQAIASSSDSEAIGRAMIDDFVLAQSHPYESDGKTLSIVKLSSYDQLLSAVDALATFLNNNISDSQVKDVLIKGAAKAQQYGKQSREEQATTLDLAGLATYIKNNLSNSEGTALSQAILDVLSTYVVYSKDDGTRPNSAGVSIVPPQGYYSFNAEVSPSSAWLQLTQSMGSIQAGDSTAPVAQNEDNATTVSDSDFQNTSSQSSVDTFYAELEAEINTLLASTWSTLSSAEQEAAAEAHWYQAEDAFWNANNSAKSRSACASNSRPTGCQGTTASFPLVKDSFFPSSQSSKLSAAKLQAAAPSSLSALGAFRGYSADGSRTNQLWTGVANAKPDFDTGVAGTRATFADDNLRSVRTVYGNIVNFEDDPSDYLASTALLQAFETNTTNEFFTPSWNQNWYIMYYGDNEEDSIWLPMEFDSEYRKEGIWYTIYTAEIDYVDADKDYSKYPQDEKFDYAKLYITVDVDNNVTSSHVRPYKIVYSSADDVQGSILYDKADKGLKVGDQIAALALYYNLDTNEQEWNYESDLITISTTPLFTLELLEFEGVDGGLLDYFYMMIGTDASGNWSTTTPTKAVLN